MGCDYPTECDGVRRARKTRLECRIFTTEPSMLISGSDDCKVKVWCTNEEASVLNIDMKANICSVKYNPGSSLHVAVGSADHHIHYYDLRKPNQPLYIFSGHRKAVSYVKFLSNHDLASASTDSTLRIWDVKENVPVCFDSFKASIHTAPLMPQLVKKHVFGIY